METKSALRVQQDLAAEIENLRTTLQMETESALRVQQDLAAEIENLRTTLQMETESARHVQRELKDHIEALRHSVSWKISAPLRYVSRYAQKLAPPLARALYYRRRFGGRAMLRRATREIVGKVTGTPVSRAPVHAMVGHFDITQQPDVVFCIEIGRAHV